MLLTHTLTRTH